eukprot:jgi/Ulvmu1/586/UM001_0594.1
MPASRETAESAAELDECAQLEEQLEQMTNVNRFLARENQTFEDYLRRVHPNMDLSAVIDPKSSKSKKRGDPKQDNFQPLTAEEKANICSHQLDYILQKSGEVQRKGEDEISEVKTMLEEVNMRANESKRDTRDFKRDVIVGAENPRSGRTMSDKFIRFMEDRLKAKDNLIEKLELKNHSLQTQRWKLSQRVAQKEQMSDMLSAVDFDQLKIENQQYLERIEEKNTELLQVKLTTGRTIQALNNIKSELQQLVAEQTRLEKEKSERLAQQSSFESDYKTASEERDKTEQIVRRMRLEQQDTDQPKILDYIKIKHEVMECEAKKGDLQRKLDIAESDAQRTARILKTIGAAATPAIAAV